MLRRSTLSCGFGMHLAVERRRLGVHVPALDPEAARQALDRDRLRDERVLLGAAERLGVHEREVREVAQVVDDQQPVGLVVHVVGDALPLRIVEVGEVEDLVGVGLRPPRPSRSRAGPASRPAGSAGHRAWRESCPGRESERSGRSRRTSARGTCSARSRPRADRSTAAHRGDSTGCRVRSPHRSRRDRAGPAPRASVRPISLPSSSSWPQPAMYQQFFRNIVVSNRASLRPGASGRGSGVSRKLTAGGTCRLRSCARDSRRARSR